MKPVYSPALCARQQKYKGAGPFLLILWCLLASLKINSADTSNSNTLCEVSRESVRKIIINQHPILWLIWVWCVLPLSLSVALMIYSPAFISACASKVCAFMHMFTHTTSSDDWTWNLDGLKKQLCFSHIQLKSLNFQLWYCWFI